MPAPSTVSIWTDAGWTIPDGWEPNDTGRCRGPTCGQLILWCWRPVSGKRSPINRDGSPHFATCPDAESFRRPQPKRGDPPSEPTLGL